MQVVLDKGQEDDWLGSPFIVTFAVLSAIGIVGMVVWELMFARHPMVDLPLFKDRSFLFTNVMMFAVGFVLFSTTQMLPQFVQQLLGYDATKAGLVLMPGGFTIMLLMPVVGFLVRKVQPKHLIAFGFILSTFALYHLSGLETQVSFRAIALARVFQAAGIAFLFVPINTLAYSGLPEGKSSNASALINLMRNLGGSVGIALSTTMLLRRGQIHQDRLVSHLTLTSVPFQQQLHTMTQHLMSQGTTTLPPNQRANAIIMGQVQSQAAALSYLDVFVVLMLGSLIAAALTTLLKTADLGKTQPGA
jgi:DHA2 family multidrug resistance protein